MPISVPITTNVVNLNHAHGEVCSIQHYVIKFAAVQWFSLDTLVSFTNTTDRYDINEILMKVACKHHDTKPYLNSSKRLCYVIIKDNFDLDILTDK